MDRIRGAYGDSGILGVGELLLEGGFIPYNLCLSISVAETSLSFRLLVGSLHRKNNGDIPTCCISCSARPKSAEMASAVVD